MHEEGFCFLPVGDTVVLQLFFQVLSPVALYLGNCLWTPFGFIHLVFVQELWRAAGKGFYETGIGFSFPSSLGLLSSALFRKGWWWWWLTLSLFSGNSRLHLGPLCSLLLVTLGNYRIIALVWLLHGHWDAGVGAGTRWGKSHFSTALSFIPHYAIAPRDSLKIWGWYELQYRGINTLNRMPNMTSHWVP